MSERQVGTVTVGSIPGHVIQKTEPKITIRARVIRADGTVEDFGVIAKSRKRSLWQRFLRKLVKS